MGNVLSGDEKVSHLFAAYDKKPRGIFWIDDHFGYRPATRSQRRAYDPRRIDRYNGSKEKITRKRSHSLGAIIGELYTREEDFRGSCQDLSSENVLAYSKSFLPRIKLNREMPIKGEQEYSSSTDMYDCSEDRCIGGVSRSSYKEHIIINEKEDNRLLHEDELEVANKPDENYFTKNFDECMKRLQIIEKEQEIMEADAGRTLNIYNLKKPLKRQMTPPAGECAVPPPEQASQQKAKEDEQEEIDRNTLAVSEIPDKGEGCEEKLLQIDAWKESEVKLSDGLPHKTSMKNAGWYTNLRKHFENEANTKEASCRVMGATLKNVIPQSSDSDSKDVKHYFSRLVRSNKSLIDEELPDPDKVQNIRAMFQESLNLTLQKNFNRLGGSLQNIHARQTADDHFARPKSAQGNSNDFVAEFPKMKNEEPIVSGVGRTVMGRGTALKGNNKVEGFPRNQGKLSEKTRRFPQPKWTDTTSLSSGVSSDFSSYETDAECCSREEMEENTTDEELQDEGVDKHYVRSETLEKIRSFGTSVTYFGGQMITCSIGPLLSPTTQAILDEIGEKYPDRKNFTRTFEQFYRKYTENNELWRKKIGRARSFGQNDVFHKPNILSNTEIDMYKNDLEMEIGIRKPSGKSQNTLRQKLVKSNSVGSRFEFFEHEVVEKLNEILDAAVEMAGKNENDPPKEAKETAIGEEGPANEDRILFGYRTDVFNRELKPDMEFEEFEVCETVKEKAEKLEDDSQSYRLTIQVNQEASKEAEELEEIVINDQEPLDSLEVYLKARKVEEVDSLKTIPENCFEPKFRHLLPEDPRRPTGSKWPIETTVMVDIQKNEELTPKLITAGKSPVKTKTRSFKKY